MAKIGTTEQQDESRQRAPYRTFASRVTTFPVTAAPIVIDCRDFGGRWVWVRPDGGDVTIIRSPQPHVGAAVAAVYQPQTSLGLAAATAVTDPAALAALGLTGSGLTLGHLDGHLIRDSDEVEMYVGDDNEFWTVVSDSTATLYVLDDADWA